MDSSMCSELPTELTRNILSSVIQEELGTNYINCSIKNVAAGEWFSSMYYVEAHTSSKTVSLYVKCLPKDSEKTELIMAYLQFKNEAAFYNIVVPAFEELQKEIIPSGGSISPLPIPHCYKALSDGVNDIIILEDLTRKGFIVLDRMKPLSIPDAFLTMKELGRFHAFSYALKKHRPRTYRDIIGRLVEPIFGEFYHSSASELLVNSLKGAKYVLKDHFVEENECLCRFEKLIQCSKEQCLLQASDLSNEPYNVITHGDPWVSNFMLHYQENCSEPDGFKFIDFQQTRYTSPACDIGRILFVTLDKAGRVKHRTQLLNSYYESLAQTLVELHTDPEEFLPYRELESQLKKFSIFFISVSIFNLMHGLALQKNDIEGLTKEEIEVFENSSCGILRELSTDTRRRMIEVIEDSFELGYMNLDNSVN